MLFVDNLFLHWQWESYETRTECSVIDRKASGAYSYLWALKG
jgi:hypothetical protein